ncbi:sulfatase-like hydrolase/transferase [Draconibacterium sediminis]|uniref:Sulfatase n=1 Tax=Draconibacterium sediminis TaxID=1544798 RepID=A0A0D8JFM2_9BACT|nr:sulfatase-like hydrolase/transferase [Draconibacterium sediminis]KJF45351.1 sulfatase [Draconibacterium sediminis]
MRKTILTAIIVSICLFSCSTDQKSESVKPNIILVFTDDFGYGDMGAMFQNKRGEENKRNNPWAFTPKLDILAQEGALLPQQYCAAPVCAPSRGSLLTGLSQGHANVRDNQFDKALADNHTLGTVLQAAGYNTAAFGKWGIQGKGKGPDWPAHPNKRGFDYYYGYIRHGDGHEHYPKEGVYRGRKEVYEDYNEVSAGLDKCYTADLWTAAAKQWIIDQKQDKEADKPFFVYLAFDTPHAVLELPTQAYPEGGGLKGGLQWLGEAGHMINTASGEVDSYIHPDYMNATWDDDNNQDTPEVPWPDVYKRYATSTRRIDDAVGDLVQLLKDLDIDENTVIIFASDNGPSKESYLEEGYSPEFFQSYGPFDGIKRDCMEGGIRVPVVAWWPRKIPAGQIINTPSISYDWLPTFAEIAGVPAPVNTNGVSLVPSLTGGGEQKEGLVYVEYFQKGNTPKYADFTEEHQGRRRNQMQMIRFGDLVGLRYDIQSHNDDFQIFNVNNDPQQTTNLALNMGMDLVQQEMKDKVLQSRRPDATAPRPYDNELIPAVKSNNQLPGIKWAFYPGQFPWVPDVSGLSEEKRGIVEKLVFEGIPDEQNGVVCFSGYIKAPADGEYQLKMDAKSNAFLKLHGCNVIDEDYGYSAGEIRSETIRLQAGMHPFQLYYLCKKGSQPKINLRWSGPEISDQQIPSTVFFMD